MAKSEYLQREEAAKKQLGTKGVKKRVKQLPTAARASLREMTGIDISRKGVSVDPIGLAMAVSPFKLLKASKALRAAGQVGKAAAVEARLGAKTIGRNIPKDYSYFPKGLASGPGTVEGKLRSASTSVFPRGTDLAKRALKAKSETRTAIRESMNYEFPFNRVVNEAERIERKYGLTQRTAEEGLRQAKRRR
jgi:hypothetical protein